MSDNTLNYRRLHLKNKISFYQLTVETLTLFILTVWLIGSLLAEPRDPAGELDVLSLFLSGSDDGEFASDDESAEPPGGNIGNGGWNAGGGPALTSEDVGWNKDNKVSGFEIHNKSMFKHFHWSHDSNTLTAGAGLLGGEYSEKWSFWVKPLNTLRVSSSYNSRVR